MKINELQQDVFCLLETRLPPHLYYHNKAHTKYVLNAAVQLAMAEAISGHELLLLQAAALLHDTGYVERIKDHEDKSCDIARQLLPGYGFDAAAAETICNMIMATKMPQQATTHLAAILCDADLFYLGTNSFFSLGETLYNEMAALQLIRSYDEWNTLQVQFLSSHCYLTAAANHLLYEKKLANLFTLKARMRDY